MRPLISVADCIAVLTSLATIVPAACLAASPLVPAVGFRSPAEPWTKTAGAPRALRMRLRASGAESALVFVGLLYSGAVWQETKKIVAKVCELAFLASSTSRGCGEGCAGD